MIAQPKTPDTERPAPAGAPAADPEKGVLRDLYGWLARDGAGQVILAQLAAEPDGGAETLDRWLRERAGQGPPHVETYISGGHVGTLVNIARADVVTVPDALRDVTGLPDNPYLGLKAFTYRERARFAGRESAVAEAVALLTSPGQQRTLLFVTGASGSGKSSFAQAGVLPELEAHYMARGAETRQVVFRPGQRPMAALADACAQLGLVLPGGPGAVAGPEAGGSSVAPFAGGQPGATARVERLGAGNRVHLVVLDQFEELFTQAEDAERDSLIRLLSSQPPFSESRTHIVATLRSDYLGELFPHNALYDLAARQGLVLREMDEESLRAAIVRPLFAMADEDPRYRGKAWEPELVAELARQAAPSAAYLPLLQLTLTELWRRGRLTLGAYSTLGFTLTNALEKRATTVLEFADHERSHPTQRRTESERQAILRIFLDLVQASVAGDNRPDVRRRRARGELLGVSADTDAAARDALVEDLAEARLLSIQPEGDVDYVDLIHESLIANWERLRQAVQAERSQLRRRARFEQAVQEWLASGKSRDYLLADVRLAEARELDAQRDVALQEPAARQFFTLSVAQAEQNVRRRFTRLLQLAALLGVFSLAAVVAAGFAYGQMGVAQRQTQLATSRQLATLAVSQVSERPEVALLLGVEALRAANTREARGAVIQHRTTFAYPPTFLRGHAGDVRAVAFSPAGGPLASAGTDGRIRLWDPTTRALAREPLPGHTGTPGSDPAIRSLAFSPNGKLLASGGADTTARLWDAITGRPIGEPLRGHTEEVQSVAFSPDNALLATGSGDHRIRLWDSATGAPLGEPLYEDGGWVEGLAFSPDGRFLAAARHSGTITLWDLETRQPALPNITAHSGETRAVAFSPDGTVLASAGTDQRIRFWRVSNGQPAGNAPAAHTDWVEALAFSPDSVLASASRDRTVILWRFTPAGSASNASAQQIDVLRGHTDRVSTVAFSAGGVRLASGGRDSRAILWEVRTGLPLTGHTRDRADSPGVESVAFAPGGARLASGGHDREIVLWDAVARTPVGEALSEHKDEVRSLAFRPDGKLLAAATGNSDRTIRIWDATTGAPVEAPLAGHTGSVRQVAYSPNGALLASASADGAVRLWDAQSGAPRGEPLRGHGDLQANRNLSVETVAFSPDSTLLASGGEDRSIRFWDVATGRPVEELRPRPGGRVWGVAFSPDGVLLAAASADGTVRLWDVATRQPRGEPLLGHTGEVRRVVFSPDGSLLASAGHDRTVRLWDVASRLPLGQPLTGHAHEVWDVAFSPDGKTVASASRDLTVRLWNVDVSLASWQQRVCQAVGRSLTADEWRQFVGDTPPHQTCSSVSAPVSSRVAP